MFAHKDSYKMNKVGIVIRKLRDKMGFTQDYMAYELEISQSSYGRLEKDDSRLNAIKIREIAKILDVSVSVLFGEKEIEILSDKSKIILQHNKLIKKNRREINSLKKQISQLHNLLEKENNM